jgi:hypothetical protein
MTHAISHLGPAFNASAVGTLCSDVDQRYVARDAKCDVGAFEFNDWTTVTITIDANVKVDAANGRALMTGTVTCSREETFKLALELHQPQKVGKQVVDVHAAAAPTGVMRRDAEDVGAEDDPDRGCVAEWLGAGNGADV